MNAKPAVHNIEREIVETKIQERLSKQKLQYLLMNMMAPPDSPKQRTLGSNTEKESLPLSVLNTFDTSRIENTSIFDKTTIATIESQNTLVLTKKKKRIKRRRRTKLPKLPSMGQKSLSQPSSIGASPRYKHNYSNPFLGKTLDEIKETPALNIPP